MVDANLQNLTRVEVDPVEAFFIEEVSLSHIFKCCYYLLNKLKWKVNQV